MYIKNAYMERVERMFAKNWNIACKIECCYSFLPFTLKTIVKVEIETYILQVLDNFYSL